jgi:hypothetical protein
MKVSLPLIVQDPMTTDGKVVEGIHVEEWRDNVTDWGDGPSNSLLVVEDFDPATGELLPGVKFEPPSPRRKMGRYVVPHDIYSREFINVSVVGTIIKTMWLFADSRALGREIKWAFDAPRLRVLPRAGEGANAFYERETGTLQFLYFPNPHNPDQTIYTSLSRDIVAHETAHAIIDAIAPALYDALTPQALAVHEALADLTALLTAFQSNTLRLRTLAKTQGSIRNPNAFNGLAPEFGQALDQSRRANALRSLWNDKTLDPADRSLDDQGSPNLVDPTDPHALSEVLSGALYKALVGEYEQHWRNLGNGFSQSGRALYEALGTFQRVIFRGLDYLPPGEVSFADYARAITIEDYNLMSGIDDLFSGELRSRHVIGDEEVWRDRNYQSFEYDANGPVARENFSPLEFVNENRSLFNIPAHVPIDILPTLRTSKQSSWNSGWSEEAGASTSNEALIKVSWEKIEEDYFDRNFPKARSITCGATIGFDQAGKVTKVLTADVDAQRRERDRMVRSLLESGLLHLASEGAGDTGPRASPIRLNIGKGVMKISGAGRLLHCTTGRSTRS